MMSTQRDYYEILGVAKGSGVDEIKKAYRRLAMKCHPDRVPAEQKKAAEEKFKEISEAYAVLSDPRKKKLYDQYGHAGIDSRYSTEDIFRGADFSSIFGNGFGDIFENIFSDFGGGIFSAGSAGRARPAGEDIHMELAVSLEDAGGGVEREISYYRYANCSHCDGSGAEPGSGKVTCSACRGRGTVTSGMGFISFSQTCPHCRGEGEIIKQRCVKCGGQGRIRVKKNLKVNIPPGVDTGSVLRMRQEGHFGSGGWGTLYIHTVMQPHPVFKRDGRNLICSKKISVLNAVLGTEVEVPTLTGKVKMRIPAGTQPNTVFRLKQKGFYDLQTKRVGDELVEVEIEVPKRLSGRERKLFEELAKE